MAMPETLLQVQNMPETCDDEIMTEMMDKSEPAHYLLEINSFSMLSKKNIDKYESNEFESGGYKWKLILFPKGIKNDDHVSLYVSLSDKEIGLKPGECVYALVRLSLFDQVNGTYFTKHQGRVVSFHRMKQEWGITKFMSLKIFTDPSNGYLVNDKCMFGVGMFVIKCCHRGDSLTLKETSSTYLHKWKVTEFSTLSSDRISSEEFTFGKYNWCVHLYPKGYTSYFDDHLSVYLALAESAAQNLKVHARYTFRLKGQDGITYEQREGSDWFSSSKDSGGWPRFMSLKQFQNCILDDCCIIEVDVTVLGEVKQCV